ncbi:hypothetical protein Q7P37_001078 [Cladosporium fusiforme]
MQLMMPRNVRLRLLLCPARYEVLRFRCNGIFLLFIMQILDVSCDLDMPIVDMESMERHDSLLGPDSGFQKADKTTEAIACDGERSVLREIDDSDHDMDIKYVTALNNLTPPKTPAPDDNDKTTTPTPLTNLPPPNPNLTILCNHSPHPFTLPTSLLTTHSRLFATLSHDASTTSDGTLHLNIDHGAFIVFARWLRGGPIHVPEGDENGFATDLYMLMRAHAAGEALGAGTFADMVVDEIIAELTDDEAGEEDGCSLRSRKRDSQAKARDLEILLQAAVAIWPPGSLGRDLMVDWYVHSPACNLHNLTVEAVVEIGDLDFAARCMVLGKERQMACELGGGGVVEAPYLLDPCRYHEHRRRGLPCYKRSRESVFSQLEYVVRCGMGGFDDCEDDGDDGFQGGMMLCEYEACVGESMELFSGDEFSLGC